MNSALRLPSLDLPDPRTAPPLGWGIVGPGWIASQFATSLINLTNSRVAAVGSRTEQRSADFALRFGDSQTAAYGSYAQVFSDPAVDAVYVAVPHSGHHELALAAIAAGKPVLVEKPLALNAEQAAQIAQAARDAGVFAMEALWSRALPSGRVIKEVLERGLLGEVLTVHGDFGSCVEFDPASRLFDPALGGGALLDLGVYPVALASLVSPAQQVLHASGRLAPTGVDSTVNALLLNQNGSTASIFTSVETQTPQRTWIGGTRATLEIERAIYAPAQLVLRDADGQIVDTQDFTEQSPAAGLGWEAAHVATCLAAGLLESELLPLDESVSIARTLDQIAAQLRSA
ncbi:Gfo/Idh/MocA family protein [Glutamicibacter sp. NPDC087344]|uniref:Gfo/Idh/MocA family protein n=1 Tax=Glutamicibacter sp. NPDC087344 TaxID=3363994 RepID=UPI0038034187